MLELSQFYVLRDEKPLFKPISQVFKGGEVWHIKGPNGRGKTTLLRALVRIYTDTHGSYKWLSANPLIYIGHKNGVQPSLTVYENIDLLFRIHNLNTSREIILDCLDALDLSLFEETPAHALSAGQFRKVVLSLLFHPEAQGTAWILDEPFTALDVASCGLIESAILKHVKTNGLVIMTSHQSNVSTQLSQVSQSMELLAVALELSEQ